VVKPAENPSATDSEAGWNLMAIRTLRQRSYRRRYCGSETHVRSAVIEVLHPRFKNRIAMAALNGMRKSKHSRRNVPPKRSHTEFALDARTGVRNTPTPLALTSLSSYREKMLSRS
jgi:hypothetical protein